MSVGGKSACVAGLIIFEKPYAYGAGKPRFAAIFIYRSNELREGRPLVRGDLLEGTPERRFE